MKVGRYEVTIHNHGYFRLDGGAMFGVIPKTMWAKLSPPDDQNRILMATNSLIIQDGSRKMIVDLGCGDKGNAKFREIFCLEYRPYEPVIGVTDVLVSHCHFDHVGGISRFKSGTQDIEPNYPDARHYVSKANLENASQPNSRERASYLKENLDAFALVQTEFTEDWQEIWPGLTVHQVNGHTRGLHWIKLSEGGTTVAFPTDLCPTSAHLPAAYVMGYDMCAQTAMEEKEDFMRRAAAGGWILVYEHDPAIAASRIELDDRGRARMTEQFEF
jgi:glyoxylase-like metal-dependent hydrolase (beta-lactamase superfamily II)